jgi:hypothetical protein
MIEIHAYSSRITLGAKLLMMRPERSGTVEEFAS